MVQSVVEEERRAVDQGPGKVLDRGQPPVGDLVGTRPGVGPEAEDRRLFGDGGFCDANGRREGNEPRVGGERLLGLDEFGPQFLADHFRDRTALLVALHRWFHDTVFDRVIASTAEDSPGPERARRRLIAFLDACRELPGVRALLLDARAEPAIAAEVDSRNRQATQILAADLAVTAHPREKARILVLAAADIAARESTQGRKLPAARRALLEIV